MVQIMVQITTTVPDRPGNCMPHGKKRIPMKKETYRKMTQPFRDNPKRAGVLHTVNKILTAIVFASYPCLLAVLFFRKDGRVLEAAGVPLAGFIVVSVIRILVNRPRPYEKFQIRPVIPKDTMGHSWPSRHVFSAAVIAFTFFPFLL